MVNNDQLIQPDQWDNNWATNTADMQWQRLEEVGLTSTTRLANYFMAAVPQTGKVLEIGCGNSQVLPMLARRRNAEVWGIDISPTGITLSEKGFKAEGVSGKLILGDAFAENPLPKAYFDVIYSLGVIEHFPPPRDVEIMAKMSEYIAPNGLMITLIPNMRGISGLLTRWIDPALYEQHVVFGPARLDEIHLKANLTPTDAARYLGNFEFGVVNYNSVERRFGRWTKAVWQAGYYFQAIYRRLSLHLETAFFSPYIIGTYRKPS